MKLSQELFRIAKQIESANEAEETVAGVFEPNPGELPKYFTDIRGKETYKDDEGTRHYEVTGVVKKEWIDKYFTKDLKQLSKELSVHEDNGPGQYFSQVGVQLKQKDKENVAFRIHIRSGRDI